MKTQLEIENYMKMMADNLLKAGYSKEEAEAKINEDFEGTTFEAPGLVHYLIFGEYL